MLTRGLSTCFSSRLPGCSTRQCVRLGQRLKPFLSVTPGLAKDQFAPKVARRLSSVSARSEQDEEDEDFDPEETLPPELKQLHIMPPTVTWGLLSIGVALIYFFGQTWADHIFVSDDDDGDDD